MAIDNLVSPCMVGNKESIRNRQSSLSGARWQRKCGIANYKAEEPWAVRGLSSIERGCGVEDSTSDWAEIMMIDIPAFS